MVAREACKANHGLRHEPQKVWRQSRRVSGWKRTSVHIWARQHTAREESLSNAHTEQVSSLSKSKRPVFGAAVMVNHRTVDDDASGAHCPEQ